MAYGWDAWQQPVDPAAMNWVVPSYDQMGAGQTSAPQTLPLSFGSTSLASGSTAMPSIPGMSVPSGNAGGGLFSGMTGMDKINAGLGGLQTLAGLWSAWQAMKMSKKQFGFTKDMMKANLGNQVKSYNTALTDRITSRAHMQGMSAAEANAYLNTHKLNTKGT